MNNNTQLNNAKIFAIHCTESKDFFLVEEKFAFANNLKSKQTGKTIPLTNRYVQWMPEDSSKVLSEKETKKILSNIRKSIGNKESRLQQKSINIASKEMIDSHYKSIVKGLKKNDIAKKIESDVLTLSRLNYNKQYDSAYYEIHSITADVVGNYAHVFQVGLGGGILMSIPIFGAISSDKAKQIALLAAIVLEVILLLGRLIGVPMSSTKAADAIAKWLENNQFLKLVLDFVQRLKAGTGDLISALYDLLKGLNDIDALNEILAAGFAGALSWLGLLWVILEILSWLIPGLGPAVKIAEIAAVTGALIAKILQLDLSKLII